MRKAHKDMSMDGSPKNRKKIIIKNVYSIWIELLPVLELKSDDEVTKSINRYKDLFK